MVLVHPGLTFPIGSMYAKYGNIYHQYTPNVSIYTSTMDPMGFWIPGESSRKEAELLHEQIRGHAVDADAEAHSSWRCWWPKLPGIGFHGNLPSGKLT